MTTADPDDARSDAAVDAEWQRIEDERIAQERAEAQEDVEPPANQHPPGATPPRWQLIAMAVALAAGVVMALLMNRNRPTPSQPPSTTERSPTR